MGIFNLNKRSIKIFNWYLYFPTRHRLKARSLRDDVDRYKRRNIKKKIVSDAFSGEEVAECAICHSVLNINTIQMHHIISYCEGGETDIANIALLCPKCHKGVHNNIFYSQRLLDLYPEAKEKMLNIYNKEINEKNEQNNSRN